VWTGKKLTIDSWQQNRKQTIECDRVVGFDELGNKDDFRTEVLEHRLGKSGVIIVKKPKKNNHSGKENYLGIKSSSKRDSDSDYDNDD